MKTILSITIFLVITLTSYTVYSQSKEMAATIDFKPVKAKIYTGDSISCEMGTLDVPENRLATHGNKIELALLKLKSLSPAPSYPIVFLAGGPGESGISYLEEKYFQMLVLQLQKNHDVILLDQRGCGRSQPSLVFKIPATPDGKEIFLSKEKLIKVAQEASVIGAAELKSRGIDINGYNTIQNADDLNDLRMALGAKKIKLLGFSYGTHLALAAVRKYPAFIEEMVLLGTSGPDHMHHLPSTYDRQLTKIAELASQDVAVNQQVPDMVLLLKKVLAKLEREPITLAVTNYKTKEVVTIPVGKFGLQMILRLDAGDSNDFINFPAMLYGIDKGQYELFQQYVEKRFNQLNGGYGSGISVMRLASGATEQRYRQIEREGKSALLGNSMNTPDIYSGSPWGNLDLGDAYRAPVKSKVRTLFISGTMDSNTPPSNVEQLLPGFANASHVLVQNAGHESTLADEKVQQLIVGFFSNEPIKSETLAMPAPKFRPVVLPPVKQN
ncbi:alpha/beta fold hydrolase [Telluribacter humicola]|uniref:alpha/beta fold hydrolase n=1 Tax=Telluribacter humicola TaxID=1720261 RepID=UPI001A95CAB0|nr:alpha/beta fold hydrolase [Telluribacter humicola]